MSKEVSAECGCASDGSYYCYSCTLGGCTASFLPCVEMYRANACYDDVVCYCYCCNYTVWENNSPLCDDSPSCTYSCACPSGYSTTKPSGDYITASQTGKKSDCSNCNGTCYKACPTVSSCSSQGYVDSCPTGSICVPRTITESVPNGCNGTRSCQLVCPVATCSSYNDPNGLPWQDTNPGGYRSQTLTMPISNPPSGCPTNTTKTCYTPNTQPNLININIVPFTEIQASIPSSENHLLSKIINKLVAQTFNDKILGYTSNDHSGRELNNQIGIKATYNDADGASDIQAVYIWWSPETNKNNFETPIKIDTNKTPKTDYTDNWGFMVTKNGTVYVPYITSTEKVWTLAESVGTGIYHIPSTTPNGEMIELSNVSFTASGSQVELQGILTFLENEKVKTEQYNLWGMANDTYGFTTYQTGGNIKDNDIWQDSGTNWTVDMVKPNKPTIATSVGENQIINLSFTTTDNESDATVNDDFLSYVRVDACYSGNGTPTPLSVSGGNPNYNLEYCDTTGAFEDIDIKTKPDLRSASPTELSGVSQLNETLEINVGLNSVGSITFYVTDMDKAGNYDKNHTIFKLDDWLVVENGLVFGATGVSSPTRELQADSWNNTTSNIVENGFLIENDLDLTNQVLLGGRTSSVGFLGDLVNYSDNLAFKASGFPGASITTVYTELMSASRFKQEKRPELFELHANTTISGNLSDICDQGMDYCVISNDTDITITQDFTCDGQALITSGGNITITPDFLNSSNSDACIILAKGDIIVKNGGSGSNDMDYDVINAFLIAGENISIEEDTSGDGTIVEGGLVAFGTEDTGSSHILNSRRIPWRYRNTYPVIAVDNNAKYGLLSKYLFGSQIEIFKLEIGFKPY